MNVLIKLGQIKSTRKKHRLPIQWEENEISGSAAYPNRHSQQISQDPLPRLQPLRYMA